MYCELLWHVLVVHVVNLFLHVIISVLHCNFCYWCLVLCVCVFCVLFVFFLIFNCNTMMNASPGHQQQIHQQGASHSDEPCLRTRAFFRCFNLDGVPWYEYPFFPWSPWKPPTKKCVFFCCRWISLAIGINWSKHFKCGKCSFKFGHWFEVGMFVQSFKHWQCAKLVLSC